MEKYDERRRIKFLSFSLNNSNLSICESCEKKGSKKEYLEQTMMMTKREKWKKSENLSNSLLLYIFKKRSKKREEILNVIGSLI